MVKRLTILQDGANVFLGVNLRFGCKVFPKGLFTKQAQTSVKLQLSKKRKTNNYCDQYPAEHQLKNVDNKQRNISENNTWYSKISLCSLCKSYGQNGRLQSEQNGRKPTAALCLTGNRVDAIGVEYLILDTLYTTDRKRYIKSTLFCTRYNN